MELRVAQQHVVQRLVAAGVEPAEARRECQLILQWAANCSWLDLLVKQTVGIEQYQLALSIVERRERREPLQYCLGEAYFRGNRFLVRPGVLIPRPETEHLVDAVLNRISKQKPVRLLEIGSGSGIIAISLLLECPSLSMLAVDISATACAVTRQNAELYKVAERLSVVCTDWRQLAKENPGRFEGIVSNPPYIAPAQKSSLLPEVLAWEPAEALFAGEDGLSFYTDLAVQAADFLVPGGFLACELGHGQYQDVARLWQEHGWDLGLAVKDLDGIDRVVTATAPAADLRNVN